MKTIELRIDSKAPGLTSDQLREKVDREVRCVQQAFCLSDSLKQIKEKQIGLLYSTCFASVNVPIVVTSFVVIVIIIIIIIIMIIKCQVFLALRRTNWGLCKLKLIQVKFNQMQVFEERGKPEYPGENLSEQRRESTNSTHI